ncbi:MAG: protein translocase subunit SecD [bacterium]
MKSNQGKTGAFLVSNMGRLLLIFLPLIIGLALLYPTYHASKLEKKKTEMLKRAHNGQDSLDILDKFEKEYGESLESAKKNSIKLGLDLRGGMYVTMEVDLIKLIEESAYSEAIDETFMEVIDRTTKQLEASPEEDAIDLFKANFDKIARPRGKTLLSYFYLGNQRDVSEDKIIEKLNESAKEAIDQAQEVIRQRIDQYGVAEPNIQKQGNRRIMLELPGVQNKEGMRALLQTTARLEFNLVRNNDSIVYAFKRIDTYLYNEAVKRGKIKGGEIITDSLDPLALVNTDKEELNKVDSTKLAANTKSTDKKVSDKKATDKKDVAKVEEKPAKDAKVTEAKPDSAKDQKAKDTSDPYKGLNEKEKVKKYQTEHPFTALFATYYLSAQDQQMVPVNYTVSQFPKGEYTFRISKDNLERFRLLLKTPAIQSLIPADYKIAIDAKPDARLMKQKPQVEVYDFYNLKKKPELTGDVVTDAGATVDQASGQAMVLMYMNSDGADQWGVITEKNLKKRIAIVLDDYVYSAPTVQTKITGGSSQITGMADMDEANRLRIVLKAGALKAPVKIIEERVVGPSLGQDSINSGLLASLVAMLAVVLFMWMYYTKSGLVADYAVFVNVLLIIALLTALKGTLSLPGIAGLILTIGMAVDANVLIYERCREELLRGRSLRSAVDEGFRKALTAIVDSNVTTAITALILLWLGSGPIRGFATNVLIGILTTMFTAIFVTRAMIEVTLARGGKYSFGLHKSQQEKI